MKTIENKILENKIKELNKFLKAQRASFRKEKCYYDDHKGKWILSGDYSTSSITSKKDFEKIILENSNIIEVKELDTNLGKLRYYVLERNYYDYFKGNIRKFRLIEEYDFKIYRIRCLYVNENKSKVLEYLIFYLEELKNINLIYHNKEIIIY